MDNQQVPKHHFVYDYQHGQGANETTMDISETVAPHQIAVGTNRRSFGYNYEHGVGQNRTEMGVRDGYNNINQQNEPQGRPSFTYRYSHGRGANRTVMNLVHHKSEEEEENVIPPRPNGHLPPRPPAQPHNRGNASSNNRRNTPPPSLRTIGTDNTDSELPLSTQPRRNLNLDTDISDSFPSRGRNDLSDSDSDNPRPDNQRGKLRIEAKQKVHVEPRGSKNNITIQQHQKIETNRNRTEEFPKCPHYPLLPKHQQKARELKENFQVRRREEDPIVNRINVASEIKMMHKNLENLNLGKAAKTEKDQKGIDFNYEHEDGKMRTRISINQVTIPDEEVKKRPSKSLIKKA